MLRLEPPRFRAHLQHADICRVVDEQPHAAQFFERVRDAAVVAVGDVAAHQPVAVNLRFGGEQPDEQRLLRHFEAEKADGVLALDGDMLREVEHEARLPP